MTEQWKQIAEEFVTQPISNPKDFKIFQRLCEEIAQLREELSLSEKYGRTADDVELINNLCSKLQSSRAANARLRAALDLSKKATEDLHKKGNVNWGTTYGLDFGLMNESMLATDRALESSDGQKELEAVNLTVRTIETYYSQCSDLVNRAKDIRAAFGLEE